MIIVTSIEFLVALHIVRKYSIQKKYANSLQATAAVIISFVAVYRSVFPVQYGERKVWANTPANSPLTIRLIALLAEVSVSVTLGWTYSRALPHSITVQAGAGAFTMLLVMAQGFATGGTLTAINLLFAIEETLWFTAALMLLLPTYKLYCQQQSRSFASVMCGVLAIYLCFETYTVYKLWTGNLGKLSDLPFDSTTNVVKDLDGWGLEFILWSSGYFTGLTALVIWLVKLPANSDPGRSKSHTFQNPRWLQDDPSQELAQLPPSASVA